MHESNSTPIVKKSNRWIRLLASLVLVAGFFLMLLTGLTPKRYQSPIAAKDATRVRLLTDSNPAQGVDQASANKFDSEIQKLATAADLQIAQRADWLTVCRRISLALMGSGMSLQDIRALEAIPEDQRIAVYLESCLADSRWSNYWSERFTRAYVGDNNGPFLLYRRRRFRLWLADQFAKDVGYDKLVHQLVTAQGLWTDRPEVNFYTATADGDEEGRADPVRIAGRTSRVFLAKRIDCLQCHDDFLGNVSLVQDGETQPGTQLDFHRLASFFDGVTVKNPLAGIADDGREYNTTLLGKTEPEKIEPKIPFEEALYTAELPRREAFAKWLTDPKNIHFSRATVNRVWALMTGRPLVAPVDDIAEDATMIAPLHILSEGFVQNHYSLKSLIRTIVSTKAFQRDSRADEFDVSPEHEQHFAVFPVTRLRPEQIALSLFQTASLTRLSDEGNIIQQLARGDELDKFIRDFGDLGDMELNGIPPTVTQRLLLLNGNASSEATKTDLVANAASRIGSFANNDQGIIEQVYLTFLNRYPTESETQKLLEQYLSKESNSQKPTDASPDDKIQTACDLGYALLNSAEMQWNH